MALSDEAREELLQRARALWEARDYSALTLALGAVERQELIGEPSLGFYLADAWHQLGERERSLELARLLAPACARRGNDRLYRERLSLEGILLFGVGDLDGAQDAWARLLGTSARAGDDAFVARANNSLGVIHTLRGDWERGVVSYGRATAAYQRLGHLRGLAQAHNNQAITYRELDFFAEADHHFQQAIAYAEADGSRDEAGRARIERSLLLCYRGDLRLAEATARHALALWERLGDALHTGEAHRVLAVVSLAARRWTEAQQHAEQALSFARHARAALLEAETRDLLAALAAQRGDETGAESQRAHAERLFASMGAGAWGTLLRTRLQRLATPA